MLDRNPQGAGDVLHHHNALDAEHVFRHLIQHQHVGGVAHVMVGLDHQQVGIQPPLRKMPLRGRIPEIARSAVW